MTRDIPWVPHGHVLSPLPKAATTAARRGGTPMGELQGIARIRFHEGMVDEFKRLTAQCMEIARTQDTGTLQYEVYLNRDESECVVLERYRDSEALIEHAAHIGALTESIAATGAVSGALLGEPSQELRRIMADGSVGLFDLFDAM